MNKKLLVTILIGIMTLAVVNAGLMTYFGQINTIIKVEQPISFKVDNQDYTGKSFVETIKCNSGENCESIHNFSILNSADESKRVRFYSNLPTGIRVDYGLIICYGINKIIVEAEETSISDSESLSANALMWGKYITIPAKGSCSFRPRYILSSLLESGNYVVNTNIDAGIVVVIE